MSTTLMTNNNDLANMWDDKEKLKEIRKLVCPTPLTDLEFEYLVGIGRSTLLNPFLRELWAVKYGNSAAQIFIGRDGYRKAAQRHPDYDYHQSDAVYSNDTFEMIDGQIRHSYNLKDRGALIGAYCIVKRHKATRPSYVYVELKEYSTGKSLWNPETGKPATMIKKVAESQALRAAFQDILAGTYCESEEFKQEEHNAISSFNGRLIEGESKTETVKNLLKDSELIDSETGEVMQEKVVFNTGRDDVLINEEQIEQINKLMDEKGFTEERKQKALNYYKVNLLSELTDAQARLFLLQLHKA